tara:strand:- start:1555 stop:2466 length:912 start_codon:yes stop_codon:yes gene_type:complete
MKKKVLVVGFSSISQRHIKILKKENFDIYLISKHAKKSKKYKKIILKKAKKISFYGILLCCPSNERLNYFNKLRNNTKKFFFEKPISDKIGNFKNLNIPKHLIKRIYVGYVLRHNIIVKKIYNYFKNKKNGKFIGAQFIARSYLPHWRKHINYKKSVSAIKSKGGGVLLELSHELDLIKHIIGNFSVDYFNLFKSKGLDIDVEDRADLILKTKNKTPINIILDFNSRLVERRFVINFTNVNYEVDLEKDSLKIINKNKIYSMKFKNLKNKMYEDQIKFFINKNNFESSFNDSLYVLKKISEIR